jgi:Flp pilus assembly protein TadG
MQIQIKTLQRNQNTARRRASTLVEMALVLPILLVLSLFIIQYGVFMNAAVSLTNLSREGARIAVVQPEYDSVIKYRMQQVCPPSIRWSDIQNNIVITPSEGSSDRKVGSQKLITVQINYNMGNKLFIPATLRFPFMGTITVFNKTYTAKSSMMVE